MIFIKRIKHIIKFTYWIIKNKIDLKLGAWKPNIMSINETIDYLNDTYVSIVRFGDGEWKWMLNIDQESFQRQDENLTKRLLEIIEDNDSRILICLSDAFDDLSMYKKNAREFWSMVMCKERKLLSSVLMHDYLYGNLNITRYYIDYLDTSDVENLIEKWKKIWNMKDIVIIEGEHSRLGVGNDLFDNSKSIRRILAPSRNAFDVYSSLLNYTKTNIEKDSLILIALGPTATVLAYDLAKNGFRALDIGHIDIEYEWFRSRAKEKIPVKYKYVNEASNKGGNIVQDILDEKVRKKYEDEIIVKIIEKEIYEG